MGPRTYGIAAGALFVLWTGVASGAQITPETVAAWDEEVGNVRSQLDRDSRNHDSFLPGEPAGVLIESRDPSGCPVPHGLIHHWYGTAFLPHVRVGALLSVMQDYDRYAQLFPPALVESRLIAHTGDVFDYRVKFVQKGLGVKAGLLADFRSRYVPFDARSGYIETEATKLIEIQNPGKPDERRLSFEEAKGLIEKSFSVMRYRETGNGVVIQIESITLSRDIPGSLRWLVSPFVRRFARQTMSSTLDRVRDGAAAEASRSPNLIISDSKSPIR